MPLDTQSDTNSGAAAHARRDAAPIRHVHRLWLVAVLAVLVPAALHTQSRRRCPPFARVPGYGACANIGGSDCGFCTYRCNDDTVVRWNVCGQ